MSFSPVVNALLLPTSQFRHLISRVVAVRSRLLLLCFWLLMAACNDNDPVGPIVPCTGDCADLLLQVDSVRVVAPGRRTTVFSGDTVQVRVFVTNKGAVSPDENTRIYARIGFEDTTITTGLIRPGASAVFDASLRLPAITRSSHVRDSALVDLYRINENAVNDYQPLDKAVSPAYVFAPTTIELRGIPGVLRYPSTQMAELVIHNRSPRALPADSIEVCVWDIDYCMMDGAKGYMPDVPAGQTAIIPFPITFSTDINVEEEWHDVFVRACYDRGLTIEACDYARIILRPDYEAFCAVKRLTIGVTLTTTSVGAGCGVVSSTIRVVVASFEAVSGRSYNVTASGFQRVALYTADGVRLGPTNTATNTGRHYIIGWASSNNISLRVD